MAPVFDPDGRLPRLLAALLLANVVTAITQPDPSWWRVGAAMFGSAGCFFAGIGLRNVRGEGRRLTVEFGDEGIDIRQPRHGWSMPWARVARVGETAEFFLVATDRAAFYLPKRALGGAEGEARLRETLHARGS